MRKMLCEIVLQKAQGYPVRYLESRRPGGIRKDRATGYAECRESAAKLGLRATSVVPAYPGFPAPCVADERVLCSVIDLRAVV
jgi:hypothetical protein